MLYPKKEMSKGRLIKVHKFVRHLEQGARKRLTQSSPRQELGSTKQSCQRQAQNKEKGLILLTTCRRSVEFVATESLWKQKV